VARGSDADPSDGLAAVVADARAAPGFLAELAAVLEEAGAAAGNGAGDPCRACGRCCHFDQMDHRLYVSTGELALLAALAPACRPRRGRCPYQVDERCTARPRRPLGCRAFFCQVRPGDDPDRYERPHGQVRRLHERHGVPYRYVELTDALVELAPAPPAGPADR